MRPLANVQLDPTNLALVRIFRREMGVQQVTQMELARRTGMAQATISRRLSGEPFAVAEVLTFCQGLGIDPITVWVDALREAGEYAKMEGQ